MPIEFPVVFWLSDDPSTSYYDSLQEIERLFLRRAKAQLLRHAAPDRSGCDPRSLLHLALFSLQRNVHGQYFPKLESGRPKSVGMLWPWWESDGMKLAYDEDRYYTLKPLPKENGHNQVTLPDGRVFEYEFYRNDSVEQRRVWFLQALQNEAWRERKEMRQDVKRDVQMDEVLDSIDACDKDVLTEFVREEYLAKLREITDSADWKSVLRKAPNDDPAERKRRSRAKRRLLVAVMILESRSAIAKTYLQRLRKAEYGERGSILDEYQAHHAE